MRLHISPVTFVTFHSTLLAVFVTADFVIFEPGLITNSSNVALSDSCLNAMQATVSCDQYLQISAGVDTYSFLDTSFLDQLCSSDCGQSLETYHAQVTSACASDPAPWPGTPAQVYGDQIWAKYNSTCLKDEAGCYCQNYFANLTVSGEDASILDLPKDELCSPCVIQLGVLNQGTSYSNYGAAMAKQWAAIQATCGVSYPTDVPGAAANFTDVAGYAPSGYPVADCLSGKTYKVVSGDDCGMIAMANGVPRGTLMSINDVLPDCSDLQVDENLCLPDACKLYTIQSGDTCWTIANSTGLTVTQLRSYNPFIDPYCSNLNAGDGLCIAQPGQVWTGTPVVGATVTKTAIYATSTVAPPGPTGHGTTSSCGKYYEVNLGDDCYLIAVNQSITVDLFEQINPSVNSGCSNLVEGLWYCVEPTANWNSTDAGNSTTCSYASAPAPTPSGTTPQCCTWYTIVSGDYCGKLEASFAITMSQLQLWNPDLLGDCSNLKLGEAYCVDGGAAGPSAEAPTVTPTTSPAARLAARSAEPTASALLQMNGRMANHWFQEAEKARKIGLFLS